MAENAAKAGQGKANTGAKMAPILIGVVLLIVGLLIGKTVLGGTKKASDKSAKAEVGISVPLDEFLVNLTGGGDHYLRATVALGLKKGVTDEELKEHVPAIRDAILGVLGSKSLKDLNKVEARDELKEELKKKVNTVDGDGTVVEIYFTAFATQ